MRRKSLWARVVRGSCIEREKLLLLRPLPRLQPRRTVLQLADLLDEGITVQSLGHLVLAAEPEVHAEVKHETVTVDDQVQTEETEALATDAPVTSSSAASTPCEPTGAPLM